MINSAHGASADSVKRVRRACVAIFPAIEKIRRRSRLGSHRLASWSVKPSISRPGSQLQGQLHDRQPDTVLIEPMQWQVRQSGVLGAPDAIFASGAAAMSEFEVLDLPAHTVGDERGQPQTVAVGDRNCAPGCGRSFLTISRMPSGQPVRSSRPVASMTQAPSRG